MSELLKINVNEHTEKKGQLTYLSWAWAWAEVLKIDPQATWEAREWNGMPAMFLPDGTAMVKVSVTIKGDTKTSPLPVMDNRNKAIKNPDAFAINTATMRALAKAIGMHGLGLYIYAGEDLPEDGATDDGGKKKPAERTVLMRFVNDLQDHIANDRELGAMQVYDESWDRGEEFATSVWNSLTTAQREYITRVQDNAKKAA